MPTATNLGLGGNPVRFLGAYVASVTNNLGLAQSPSTSSITLAEDQNSIPKVLFQKPTLGSYDELIIGSKFKFGGVITKYEEDVANISGKTIRVEIADPREIMKAIPIILAPGFRNIVSEIQDTECSVIDAFGAFDDDEGTGTNLSGWNQSGIEFGSIILSLSGGTRVVPVTGGDDIIFDVPQQAAKAFGEVYVFDLSQVSPLVNQLQRINTNLISMADFIQELATNNSFDWFVQSERRIDNAITITIVPIDRRTDNIDLDLDNFLAANSGSVISAKRGFELRNDIACSVILGAPIEQLLAQTITGMANNPVDIADEGGSSRYFMTEKEMRIILGTKASWEAWVSQNGDMNRYGISDLTVKPLFTSSDDDKNQLGRNKERSPTENKEQEKRRGKVYEKLKGHAEATYGKRFLFSAPIGVDYIDSVWTVDVLRGTSSPKDTKNANEFFRDSNGKTRAYVEFVKSTNIVFSAPGGIGVSFAVGKGQGAAVTLPLELANAFDPDNFVAELDKSNYIRFEDSLFVAATIEEGNIIKLDAPIVFATPDLFEFEKAIEDVAAQANETTADGTATAGAKKAQRRRDQLYGAYNALIESHSKAYQPKIAYIPVRSTFTRYGPIFSNNIDPTSQGRLEIIQDDGFSPWEFGGTQSMLDAMQFKVDNQASNVREVETADITVEGFPTKSIGDSIGQNSNINSISISFGGQVTTSYRLQSFQRRFGELSKEELALLSLYARRGGARTLPQDTVGFAQRYRSRIQKQFGGVGYASTSANIGGASSFE